MLLIIRYTNQSLESENKIIDGFPIHETGDTIFSITVLNKGD